MKSILLSLLFAFVSITVTAAPTHAQAVTGNNCSAVAQNSIVIEQAQVLLSHDAGGAFIGPVTTAVPAGTYNLSTMSHEDHIGSGDPTQDNETWYFEGYNNGALVYTSPTTTDIPDDINTVSDNFGEVVLPELDAIRWVHAAFPDPTYQSVYPSCIDFAPADTSVDLTCVVSFTVTDGLSVMGMATIGDPGIATTIEYNLGDGTIISVDVDEKINHTYASAGTYTITATSNNPKGGALAQCSTQITVSEPATTGGGAVLGTTDDTGGAVLGATTDNNGGGGAVLGAQDTLANTGAPAALQMILGLALAGVALFSSSRTVATKRSN